ncbi:hypothetical protein BDV96DRAFT_650064 [Lophiotrema nucula]|uniref:SH3 domain-containing protein n=1 Tax=Lophiotrema nucula TaxID=690887 RepID=A0A6A5YY56_9PLEO|nr:hypothetical protein BDV96DRAFT_650064 [Lophiotrema nucula]
MTRPQIIRADTLDLQDKTSPTAQDHSHQLHPAPLGIGPAAPHQEASLRRVEDERQSEESHLQNGWSDANTLREDPDSDDERTIVASINGDRNLAQDDTAIRLNGGMSGSGEDGEMADADVEEDMDDDMMDKISSSPSIDDGVYSSHSSPPEWLGRSPPRTPEPTPTSSLTGSVASSSPYTLTPVHFPISTAAARRPLPVPAGEVEPVSKSPFRSSPIPFSKRKRPSVEHHHNGRYRPAPRSPDLPNEISGNANTGQTCGTPPPAQELNVSTQVSPRSQHRLRVEARLQVREDSHSSLLSDFDEEAVQSMLQPVPSPLEDSFGEMSREATDGDSGQDGNDQRPAPRKSPLSNEYRNDNLEDDGSWTTDSDADSWIEGPDDDDDSNDISFSDDPRYTDSGWGGECLREVEDIDFEFVYALHTFVATVEGQANATKGDTMVLLDDSNSYWWLVRVVKDSSIGYLPAEHIETPTERLARLNKHRNIDLSATMLGDTAEKTKNPLKKAMRRRNAKTVQFGPPTYVDAVEEDYSSDEDGNEELFGGADPNQVQAQTQEQTQTVSEKAEPEQDDGLQVQPLKVSGPKKETISEVAENDPSRENAEVTKSNGEKQRSSDEIFDRPLDPKVSRNGTLRNTDSFFKDDNAETRKITLTPNLLRDDSSTSTTGSKERGPSLESLEKNGFADKVKEDKKKKEKKPGMLSGLFKRKEKKPKGAGILDSFDSDAEKQSEDLGRNSPQSKGSDDASMDGSSSPQRQASKGKLQKPQRSRDGSPAKNIKSVAETGSPEPTATVQAPAPQEQPTSRPTGGQGGSTMRMVSPERQGTPDQSIEARVQSPLDRSRSNSSASKLNPINMLKSQQNGEPRPEKVKKAKQRVQLDDFDSEEDEKNDPFADSNEAEPKTREVDESEPTGRLSESPVQISAADAQPPGKENFKGQDPELQQTPELTGDTSSQETSSPISTPSPDDSPSTTAPSKPDLSATRANASPSPSQLAPIPQPSRPAPIPTKEMEDSSVPNSSESTTLPAWSDANLRAYLDDGSDIRDMLVVINDTTGVVPVGPEHPIMSRLFVEETKTVTQMGGELDGLLTRWLETKRKKQKTGATSKVVR